MARVAVAGHICVDVTPELPTGARIVPGQLIAVGPMAVRLGGCVANTGLALRALGSDATLQAVVGDDVLGGLIEQLLGDRGQVTRLPGCTTSYSVVVEPPGQDRTFWHHTGANSHFDPDLVDVDADLLHVGYPPLLPGILVERAAPLCGLLDRARAAQATCSLDLAVVDRESDVGRLDWDDLLSQVLPRTDVASPSADDLASMLDPGAPPTLDRAEAWCDDLLRRGAAVAMVTAGANGLVLRSAGLDRVRAGGRVLAALGEEWDHALVRLPAVPSTSHVTATGAGDAASAGLVHALTLGCTPQGAAELAAETAATVMSGRSLSRVEVPR
ncbi:MAG: carbohydrate kinase family protein [Actinomycetia bacterium]|nr:carbohydrate kinase family protein [Actinomycetes bacterium]